ncbi:MAG TPA: TIGR00730 family Rossman fold protein [Caulobacteraceae bacterium]|nr:TIGR00730 family Rossman fold protein [Caulobacteraceae bacterium]
MRFCVFMGSSFGRLPAYREAAAEFGRLMTARGVGVVYGGNTLGLMGVLAETAFALGAEVIGVIPHSIAEAEAARTELTKLHVVDTMHERKALMSRLSDAFVALPGGLGTLEELFEVWTWAKLGIQARPIGVLNVAGFYDRLLEFIRQLETEGFVAHEDHDLIVVSDNPGELVEKLIERVAARPATTPGAAVADIT